VGVSENLGRLLNEVARQAEVALSLPVDFFLNLLEADDLTLLIKTHAVAEALAIHALVGQLERPSFATFAEKLSMRSRLDALEAAHALPLSQITFLRRLSTIRNDAAHTIGRSRFSFADYVKAPKQRQWVVDLLEASGLGRKDIATLDIAAVVSARIWLSLLAIAASTMEVSDDLAAKVHQADEAMRESLPSLKLLR
jgi:hypothetical protein